MIKLTSILGLGFALLASADAATPPHVELATTKVTLPLRPAPTRTIVAAPSPDVAGAPAQSPTAVQPSFTVLFAPGSADLLPESRAALDAAAARMVEQPDLTAELRGYAPATNEDQSQARRLSLARILLVRGYLIDEGVSKLRLTVHPLGDRTSAKLPPDRVDLVTSAR